MYTIILCIIAGSQQRAAAGPIHTFESMLLDRNDEFHRFNTDIIASWGEANAHCASQNMYLASVRDEAQWNAVKYHLRGCAIGGITTVTEKGVYSPWYWVDTPSPEKHRFSGLAAAFGIGSSVDSLGLWNVGYWVWDNNEPSQFVGSSSTKEEHLNMRVGVANDVSTGAKGGPGTPPDTIFGSAVCVRFRCNSADDCNGNADDAAMHSPTIQYYTRDKNAAPCVCRCKAGYSGPTCWHAGATHGNEHYVKFTGTWQAATAITTACQRRHPYMFAGAFGSPSQNDFVAAYAGDKCQMGAVGTGSSLKWLDGRWEGSNIGLAAVSLSVNASADVGLLYRFDGTTAAGASAARPSCRLISAVCPSAKCASSTNAPSRATAPCTLWVASSPWTACGPTVAALSSTKTTS